MYKVFFFVFIIDNKSKTFVVVEEFKQTCLNQPYGDVWQLLRPICYEVHSYSWSTIGKKIEHIEDANIQEVKSFFYKHYTPSNAILSESAILYTPY